MVTPLDVGLLQKFDVLFPFLFILIICYAVLARTEWLKEKQIIAALLAFVLAIMALFSPLAVKTINRMAPWFVLLVIFGILIILAIQALGITEKKVIEVIAGDSTVAWWVISLMIIIAVGSLLSVLGEEKQGGIYGLREQVNVTSAPSGAPGFWATILHPKVLGMILLLLIGMFTIQKLASPPE